MGTRRRLFPWLLALALAVSIQIARSAEAAEAQPDPSRCPEGGDGYFYVAMGVDVFRWQPETFAIFKQVPGDVRDDEFLAPPDPSQPAGCRDNPVRVLGGAPVIRIKDLISGPAGSDDRWMYIGLKVVSPDYTPQPLREEDFTAVCEGKAGTGAHRTEQIDPPGLIECSVQTLTDQSWRSSYKVRPESYQTPLGEALIIPCLKVGLYDCWTGYKLNKTLQLSYMFNLNDVAIERIIDLDRALRAKIESARVKNYAWPKP